MAPMMVPAAEAIADLVASSTSGPLKVLDIAAGHGLFGITIAKRNLRAEIVALDWKNVLTVAEENARAAQVSDRYRTLAGDVFKIGLGDGYDLALVTNFLHHFDQPTCTTFLRRVHQALKPGGRVAVLEFVPNPDRVSPPFPARFALTMLAETPGGDAYTFDELRKQLEDAGFQERYGSRASKPTKRSCWPRSKRLPRTSSAPSDLERRVLGHPRNLFRSGQAR